MLALVHVASLEAITGPCYGCAGREKAHNIETRSRMQGPARVLPPTCDAARCSSLLNPANRKSGALPRATINHSLPPFDGVRLAPTADPDARERLPRKRNACSSCRARATPEVGLGRQGAALLDR